MREVREDSENLTWNCLMVDCPYRPLAAAESHREKYFYLTIISCECDIYGP